MYLVYFTINLVCPFALETCLKIIKVWSWLEKTKTSWIVGKLLSYAWGSTQKGYFQMIKVWWVPYVLLLITFERGKNKHVMKYDVVMWAILANFKVVDAILCWHNIVGCGKYHNILCTVVWVVRHVNLTFAFSFVLFEENNDKHTVERNIALGNHALLAQPTDQSVVCLRIN